MQRWRNLATHLPSANAFFWKGQKINFSSSIPRDEKSPKITFTVREKRRNNTKKEALNRVLYNGGVSPSSHELAKKLNNKSRVKPTHHSKIAAQRKLHRKHQREDPIDANYDDSAKEFFASFGKVGSNSNFRNWEQRSDWKQITHSNSVTYANRKILGLPETGSLKIEDVKTAFRSSALKWHPDRHQRSARAAAEEQFKHCVDAYKSLCASLSSR